MSRLGVDELGQGFDGFGDRFLNVIRKRNVVQFRELQGVQINVQNKTVIVERVHRVGAVGEELGAGFAFEGEFPKRKIFFGVFQFREQKTDHPKGEGFGDGMVAARENGEGPVPVDALGLGGNVEFEFGYPFRCGGRRVQESVVAERPCHKADGDLLSVHPVGTGIRRVVSRPIFDQSPEGFGVFFVVRGGVGSDEGVDKGEAAGFPDEFDVSGCTFGDLRPVFIPLCSR